MVQQYNVLAPVDAVEMVTPDICRLTMAAPEIATAAEPGQFVMVRLPGEGQDPLLRRPFSIHQVNDTTVQILLKVVGRVTRQLAALQPGEKIDLLGPLGRGFRLDPLPAGACLVGGGIGAAPLRLLARQLGRRLPAEKIVVLLGARNRIEVTALAETFAELGCQVQIATDDGSAGHHGLVGDLLTALATPEPMTVYACGPHPMLAGVAGICRQKQWRCQVSLETMMACGVAACLGCAVAPADPAAGYLHVCKEGPVFEAGEVSWK